MGQARRRHPFAVGLIVTLVDAKRTKIIDLLEKIEERLQELEEEKAELKDFQEKDKERRCLEYAIYSRELADVEEALEGVSEGPESGLTTTSETDIDRMIIKIEDGHSKDVDSNNAARKQFDDRELEIQVNLELDLSVGWLLNILDYRSLRNSRQI